MHEALRHGRTQAGYTQKAVADSIGVDVTTYAHYELGRREPNRDQLEILSLIMEIPEELIPETKAPVRRTTIYPAPLLDNLEQTINQFSQGTEYSKILHLWLSKLDDALKPVMEIRNRTLSTKGIGYALPTGTTILNVNLDKRAEDLISLCHQRQSELIEYWMKNAKS